ncbi:MAG: DUF2029 domain-containing protein [Armatimonadetes bacterium]|nr:DUF2029 domain-containing protein [Armatimonadota bacterium]
MDPEDRGLALRVPTFSLLLALIIAIAMLWFLPEDGNALRALSGGGFVPWWVIQGIMWLWLFSLCAWGCRHRARHAGIVALLLVIALGIIYARPGGWYAMAVPEPSFEGMKVGYWDGQLYWDSAIAYRNGDNPFRINWYPPTFLKTFALLTHTTPTSAFAIWWLVVVASFLASVIFSYELLLRWHVTPLAATVLCGLLWIANSPAVLTIGALQASLTMLCLMLMSYVWLSRRPILSALSLAAAIGVKVSPLLIGPMLGLVRRYTWLFLLILGCLLVACSSLPGDGLTLWRDFLFEVSGKVWQSDSIDTLARRLMGPKLGSVMSIVVKVTILIAAGILLWAWRNCGWSKDDSESRDDVIQDAAFAVGCVCIVLIAPVIWAGHRVWFVPPLLFCWVHSHYRWLPLLWVSTALLLWLPMIPHLGIANVLPPGLILLWCLRPDTMADDHEDSALGHLMEALTTHMAGRGVGRIMSQ